MSEMTLAKTRIHAGIWEGVLTTPDPQAAAPEIAVTHLEKPITTVAVSQDPETPAQWIVRIVIPPELMSDGVQTFVIWDAATEQKLNSFAIVAGEPLEDDIRAELDLLRAELDMLKRAFRRHCVETSQA